MAHVVTLKKLKSIPPAEKKVPSFMAHHTRAELQAMGKALRDKCPRASHAEWKPPHSRPDPVRLVLKADEGRIPDLLPLRHGARFYLPSPSTEARRWPWRRIWRALRLPESACNRAVSVSDGVWMYQLTDRGLALEITAKSTSYYKDGDLN
jgi:hypothetical protein